jgi:cytochrome c peroxidase
MRENHGEPSTEGVRIMKSHSGAHGRPRRPVLRKALRTSPASAVILLAAGGGAMAQTAPAKPSPLDCPGYSVCPTTNYAQILQESADARHVVATDNTIEARALARYQSGNVTNTQAEPLLGELIIYDPTLSVNSNVPCATCHTQTAGFTGGVGLINNTNVAFSGSTGQRSSARKPMSYAYAPFAPVLFYRASTGDFVGGNFWDMRATGLVTGNPAADQPLGPPLNPVEMDNSDPACVVYRIAIGPYSGLFEPVWGAGAFAITWPAKVEKLCDIPLSKTTSNPTVLQLSPADRALATQDFYDMGISAAAYESSPAVSPFSSKFDAWQAGKAQLTVQEMRGYTLFNGKAMCSQCHVSAGPQPLFTDFTAVNLGIPRNPELPFIFENRRDGYGYDANPLGPKEVDNGVGAFLASAADTNPQWQALAPKFMGTFQVGTARNTARAPYDTFIKSYMHHGYFKTLKQVVHFYNTRDVLARCQGDPEIGTNGAGTTCWPAPEQPANENTTQIGNLGLNSGQEDNIVAFLGTLTDGFAAN